MRVLGRATSSNVQPIMWCATELGLEPERVDMGGPFGGLDTPEFLAKNPMGLIPVLEDGDLTLFESNAILRYLVGRYGPESMWPFDPAERAKVDQWMEWAKVNVYPTVTRGVFWQLIRVARVDRDVEAVAAKVAECNHLMGMANAQLERHDWLAGQEMTAADYTFGTALYRWMTLPVERTDLPALAAYYQRLTERPAYRTHAMVDYESMKVEGA